MYKKISIILSFIIFLPVFAAAEPEVVISEFSGGSVKFNVGYYSDMYFGSRGDAARNGGTVSTLDFIQSFTSYNPACLAFQDKAVYSMSMIPFEFLNTNLVGGIIGEDFNEVAIDELSSAIEEGINDNDDLTIGSGVDIGLDAANAYAGQWAGIMGFEAMVPFANNQAAVGVAREEKTAFALDFILSGLSTLVNVSDPADPAMPEINLRATIDGVLKVEMRNVTTSLGLGRQISEYWGVGVVLEHFASSIDVDGQFLADAVGTFIGSELEFNTRPDNMLDQTADIGLYATAWGLRVGTAVHSEKDLVEFAADLSIQPELKYEGGMDILLHTIDFDNIYMDFWSGYTVTTPERPEDLEEDLDLIYEPIALMLPSYIRVGLAYKPDFMVMAINYIRYITGMRIKAAGQTATFNLCDEVRIGFNFKWFQIGGGVVFPKLTLVNEDGDVEIPYWGVAGVFSTGFIIPIGEEIMTEWQFLTFPGPILKAALTYMF